MKHITAVDNPTIKKIIRLHTSKGRAASSLFIAEGLRVCNSFIEQGYIPHDILVTQEFFQKNRSDALFERFPYILTTEQIIKKISSVTTPSGLLMTFSIPQISKDHLTAGIVLAQIQDPGNMGTLIRTAAAVGADSVIIIEGTDPWSPKVVQASAGALALVKIFTLTWAELISYKKNLILCALVIHKGELPHTIPPQESLIIVGNEGQGLPLEWQKQCDRLISIPMPGGTESLNAAVAGSIALYLTYVKS